MDSQFEIIKSIKLGSGYGFIIETDKQTIKAYVKYNEKFNMKFDCLLFDNQYVKSEYYFRTLINGSKNVDIDVISQKYQNSVLYKIKYNTEMMWGQRAEYDYETYSDAFDIVTSRGTFTIGFMNIHDGSYSHECAFESHQLTNTFVL